MRRICLALWLLACTMGGLTRPLAGQWVPREDELSSHAVGVGISAHSDRLLALHYMHRLPGGSRGVGVDLSMAGITPQVQARTLREPDRPGPPGVGESVRHTTFGFLLSPGGFTLAGKDVSAGIAAVLGIGGQVWPPSRSWLPFLDLSAGATFTLTGLEGRPGATLFARAYLGIGW